MNEQVKPSSVSEEWLKWEARERLIRELHERLSGHADAVYRETGLTPRQLAEQRKELMEALHKIAYEPIGDAEASAVTVLNGCVEIARAALAHARGERP